MVEYTSKNHFSISLVSKSAVLPSKRGEDAGWDIYADLKGEEFLKLPAMTPTKVPTGLAMAFSKDYSLNLGSERSSIAKRGIQSIGGVIDSGYRGEIFVNLLSIKDAVIYHTEERGKEIEFNEEDSTLYIPSTKAIAQGIFHVVPDITPVVEPYDKLKQYVSERGTGALGSSGK